MSLKINNLNTNVSRFLFLSFFCISCYLRFKYLRSFMSFIVNKRAHCSNVAWAVCLNCTKYAFKLWCFKSDDCLLLGENVEGCCNRLYSCLNCLLLAVECSTWTRLSIHRASLLKDW